MTLEETASDTAHSSPRSGRAATAVFTVAIFSAAALLFTMEPLAARLILPVLGGSPVVWITALAFFQVTLLLGYTYAHITSRLSQRNRAITHGAVLASALIFLPIALPAWDPPASGPYLWLVGLMTVAVGLPFFVLASASPGLAQWYADGGRRDPYFLYAVSNAGSFVGLLSYPLLIEPTLGLSRQVTLWAWGFGIFAVVAAAAVIIALRADDRTAIAPQVDATEAAVSWPARLKWVGLAFVPSSLLLGSTTFITSEIGSVPLLWVVPLATYLLTFVLAFRDRKRPLTDLPSRVLILLVFGVMTTFAVGSGPGLLLDLTLHVGLLFAAGLVAHHRLYAARPGPQRLTEFYLLISLGGALGGVFNAFLAPLMFDWALEYPLVIVAAVALTADRSTQSLGDFKTWVPALAAAAIGIAVDAGTNGLAARTEAAMAVVAIGLAALILFAGRRAVVLALGVGLLFAIFPPINDEATFRERTFFGILSVRQESDQRAMFHGSTLHGIQYVGDRSGEPAAYYSKPGPLGDIFRTLDGQLDVGLVGLGVGTIAAYGQSGDKMTYFEIDSAVVTLARDRGLFSFLGDSAAEVEIIVEDGRLGLERSATNSYDLIVLDAFTADAIPVHLLTVEALETYLDRATEDGIVAIHVSNRFFDLEPALAAAAAELGAAAVIRRDSHEDRLASRWVAMAQNPKDLEALLMLPDWRTVETTEGFRLWTDDYSNPLSVYSNPLSVLR